VGRAFASVSVSGSMGGRLSAVGFQKRDSAEPDQVNASSRAGAVSDLTWV